VLLTVAVGGLAPAGCGGGMANPVPAQLTFNVTDATTGRPIRSGFVGLSIEIKALEDYTGTNAAAVNPVFLHLIEDLAPDQSPVLRLGGDSTDWSWYPVSGAPRPPGVTFTLTPNWLDVARTVATATRARLILGVDLEADNRAVAAAEANAMVNRIGRSSLAALELGNEPELYGSFGWYRSAAGTPVPGRPRDYDPVAFERDYSSFAPHLPDVRLAGPSSGAPTWLAKLGSFLQAEPRVRLATVHAYPLKHCTRSKIVTTAQLLSEQSSRGLAETVAPYVAVAAAHHDPLRVDEMNGISCGGTRGVSDTFASALWVLDALFEMARTGVIGVNVHTVPGTVNEIIGPVASGGQTGSRSMRVHPEYYGMMMFAQAFPPGARFLPVSVPNAPLKVWADQAPDGHIRVEMINKDPLDAYQVQVQVPNANIAGRASLEYLQAPGVSSTSGVTLGGQTFGTVTTTGSLPPPQTQPALAVGSSYTVNVPAASAVLLTQ
jgi:Glycosyl hydrolase family 79 C-terminal beta domain